MQLQVGVKVIIQNSAGRYLLIARSEAHQLATDPTASWDIPGGRIKPEEPLLDALNREIQEEIGVAATLTVLPELVAAQDIFVEKKGLHVVRLTFLLAADITDIMLSDEHREFAWFTAPELKELSVEPYLRAVLDEVTAV